MCQLKREQGVWWFGLGANKRRDDDEDPAENVENEEEQTDKEAKKGENSSSGEKFYDALSDKGPVEAPDVVVPATPEVPVVLLTAAVQQTMKRTSTGVDPSGSSDSIPDFDFIFKLTMTGLSRGIPDFWSCTTS
ncbi:hypothetical protein Dimus_003769 [Dionaea muscipula]